MNKKYLSETLVLPAVFLLALSPAVSADTQGMEPIERLGKRIFFDEELSINRNQSCSTCHVPDVGWVGDDDDINTHGAVYEGSIEGEFGNRKPPSSAYASLAPIFYADFGNRLLGDNDDELALEPLFVGGNFWDGRATGWELGNPSADQAQGPFLNPVEQALPDAACVVYRVCESNYRKLFDDVWGGGACMITWPADLDAECAKTDGEVMLSPMDRNKVDAVYDRIALSIAAFEGSQESNAFTSKIDAHRADLYDFNEQEELGRQVFRGKGQCAACHVGTPGRGAAPPLFTDFTYDNLGVPKNPENPFTVDNPDWQDPGLAGFLENVSGFSIHATANQGKQKVPTLRNVGLGSCEALDYEDSKPGNANPPGQQGKQECITKAYMHNGFFKSLKSVVHFYNTRDLKQRCEDLGIDDATEEIALANDCWPEPEVDVNVNIDELGNLGLTEEEEDALVAFMMAMSDGYMKSSGKGKTTGPE
jgi:cytochrome c peroxidase